MTGLSPLELVRIIEQASEKGAMRALERVGLHDEGAGSDVRELRNLLEAYRDIRTVARQTVVRFLTRAFLLLIVASAVLFGIDAK